MALLVEFSACIFHPLSVMTAASFLLGMCLYINGMLKDLVYQIGLVDRDCKQFTANPYKKMSRILQKMIKEIRYHEEIIEYVHLFWTFGNA